LAAAAAAHAAAARQEEYKQDMADLTGGGCAGRQAALQTACVLAVDLPSNIQHPRQGCRCGTAAWTQEDADLYSVTCQSIKLAEQLPSIISSLHTARLTPTLVRFCYSDPAFCCCCCCYVRLPGPLGAAAD
jgi:hypothetical protein